MLPNATILSILDRYKHNQPVSIEEKAVFHYWLISSLKTHKKLQPDGQLSELSGISFKNITTEEKEKTAYQINKKRKRHTYLGQLLFKKVSSIFFRIFALCPPLKK